MRRSSAKSDDHASWLEERNGRVAHWNRGRLTACGRVILPIVNVRSSTGVSLDDEVPKYLAVPPCKTCMKKWRQQWLKRGHWSGYGKKRRVR